jgi:hypothetical protein
MIQRISLDDKLKPGHVSLLLTLFNFWITNNFKKEYQISRSQLMRMAHIQSKATYHKIISELIDLDYINYIPSFHPKNGSKIQLIFKQKFQNS